MCVSWRLGWFIFLMGRCTKSRQKRQGIRHCLVMLSSRWPFRRRETPESFHCRRLPQNHTPARRLLQMLPKYNVIDIVGARDLLSEEIASADESIERSWLHRFCQPCSKRNER
jgi:hypothetical protein